MSVYLSSVYLSVCLSVCLSFVRPSICLCFLFFFSYFFFFSYRISLFNGKSCHFSGSRTSRRERELFLVPETSCREVFGNHFHEKFGNCRDMTGKLWSLVGCESDLGKGWLWERLSQGVVKHHPPRLFLKNLLLKKNNKSIFYIKDCPL